LIAVWLESIVSDVPGAREWVTEMLNDQPEVLPTKRALAYKPKNFKLTKTSGSTEFKILSNPLVRLFAIAVTPVALIIAAGGIAESNPLVSILIGII